MGADGRSVSGAPQSAVGKCRVSPQRDFLFRNFLEDKNFIQLWRCLNVESPHTHTPLPWFRNLSSCCMCPSVCLIILRIPTSQTRSRPVTDEYKYFPVLCKTCWFNVRTNYPTTHNNWQQYALPTLQHLLILTMLYIRSPQTSKGKGHPTTGHQGPSGIFTLTLNLGARRGWVVSTTPRPLYPRKRPGTHCTGGWVGPRAGLDVCETSRPHLNSSPGPSSP
jgi:hypothetical protein